MSYDEWLYSEMERDFSERDDDCEREVARFDELSDKLYDEKVDRDLEREQEHADE